MGDHRPSVVPRWLRKSFARPRPTSLPERRTGARGRWPRSWVRRPRWSSGSGRPTACRRIGSRPSRSPTARASPRSWSTSWVSTSTRRSTRSSCASREEPDPGSGPRPEAPAHGTFCSVRELQEASFEYVEQYNNRTSGYRRKALPEDILAKVRRAKAVLDKTPTT